MLLNGQTLYGAGNPLSALQLPHRAVLLPVRRACSTRPARLDAPADWTNLSADRHPQHREPADVQRRRRPPSTANRLVDGDPVTPIFRAPAGMPARFRLLMPGGIGDNQQVFELTGHVWQEEPYTDGSTKIGFNPKSNWTAR